MILKRTLAVLALVALGAGLGYLYAQDRGGPGKLSAEDRLDIQELYWRYAQGHDFRDAELVASAFAEDGVFRSSPDRAVTGRAAIAESLGRGFAGRGPDSGRRHWQNAWRITPTAEGARGRVYWVALEVGTGDPIPNLPVDRAPRSALPQHGLLRGRIREDGRGLALQEPRAELGRAALAV